GADDVDRNLVHVEERARWKGKAATSPDRETIPEAEYFDRLKMSGNPAKIKAQCEPTEPTEGPTDFPRIRRLYPAEITRRAPSPVSGSLRSGSSWTLCLTSKVRIGLAGSVVS